jgi:glycosyltransferase involved in cell wall biosynthesis
MHILLTVNTTWNVWNFRQSLVRTLVESGHRVTILAPKDKAAPKIQSLGCRFRHLEMNGGSLNPLEMPRLARQFKQSFESDRPDIIFSYTIKNNLVAAMVAKRLAIPFVPNVSGLGTAFLSSKWLAQLTKCFYRAAFKSLPVVFFQNSDDRQLFIESGLINQAQAQLLPGSGVDLEWFSPVAPREKSEKTKFLMVARLLRDKGVEEYVEAARIVRQIRSDVTFQLLGPVDTSNRSAIDKVTLDKWIAEDVIEYSGEVDDVRPYVAASSCVVLPSYREGAPRTLIEAAAMARPIIATRVPGCTAVVDEGKTGLLCDAKSAERLADCVMRFLELSPEEQADMGRAGRAKMVREFDQSIVVQSYLGAMDALCNVRENEQQVAGVQGNQR